MNENKSTWDFIEFVFGRNVGLKKHFDFFRPISYQFQFLLKTSQLYILLLNNLFNPKVLCMSCPVIILCSRSFFKLDCTESRKEIQCFTPHVFIKTESEIWFLSRFNNKISQWNEASIKYSFSHCFAICDYNLNFEK